LEIRPLNAIVIDERQCSNPCRHERLGYLAAERTYADYKGVRSL